MKGSRNIKSFFFFKKRKKSEPATVSTSSTERPGPVSILGTAVVTKSSQLFTMQEQ